MSYGSIGVEEIDDVSVVTFCDAKMFDDARIQQIGTDLYDLVSGGLPKKVILDFADVEFISSSAIGVVIQLDKQIKSAQGKLILAGLAEEVHEVFVITRLNKLIEICEDREEAIRRMGLSVEFQAKCPIDVCDSAISVDWNRPNQTGTKTIIRCPGCDASLSIARRTRKQFQRAIVSEFRVPTYEGQSLRVTCPSRGSDDQFFSIEVIGELDLFVSESLEKALNTIPYPRAVLIDLTQSTRVTAQASANLSGMRAANQGSQSGVAVLRAATDDGEPLLDMFPSFGDRSEAVELLRERCSESKQMLTLELETIVVN